MEKLEQIKKHIQPILEQFNVSLYELNWHRSKKASTLQVAIMYSDGSMDLDTCANVSEKISEVLDKLDLIEEEYFLEVCSPGAERKLRNEKELREAVEKKIYVRFKQPVKGMMEANGKLLCFEAGILTIEYRDKAAVRRLETEYDNVDFIRLAV